MSFRETMENNSAVVTGGAAVVMLLAIGAIVWQMMPQGPAVVTGEWFYDLSSGQLYLAEVNSIPPIDAPSGGTDSATNEPAGVRAYVYACGECSSRKLDGKTIAELNDMGIKIGWLEKYPPKAREVLRQALERSGMLTGETTSQVPLLIRSVEGTKWIPSTSREGSDLMNASGGECGDQPVVPCIP